MVDITGRLTSYGVYFLIFSFERTLLRYFCRNARYYAAYRLVVIITGASAIFGMGVEKCFGHKFEKQTVLLGGLLLILIGSKVLLEHTVFAG